ncbi:P-loop containing nucleoside triphosphate hydrolase protein [Cokeromyces recurvatus]|uniref:P-loop containing nucleoside triphosphate hydrolase protein n=1 Tax=Cokeromyces recurvatus TaxID=90255 RepID=UPI00221EDFAB|nr:P-loop containing nucleoside triphosphate hydrolase protein [Cokeromyces recurvatus]KAI7898973.1 P-loop containing nucleoside triphosphate hydrolase protein [Cokeromyces recurvatus]
MDYLRYDDQRRYGEKEDPRLLEVTQCPTDAAALTNCAYITPGFMDPKIHYIIVDREHAFSVKFDRSIPKGQIGFNSIQRRWASFSIGQKVIVEPFDVHSEGMDIYLGILKMEIDFFSKSNRLPDEFKEDDLAKAFSETFYYQIFSKGQSLVFEYCGVKFKVTIQDLAVVDLNVLKKGEVNARQESQPDAFRGILMRETNIELTKAEGSFLNLKPSKNKAMRTKALIKPDFKFEDLGIGGLDDEFNAIFRRAFASRIFPPALVEKLGVQHVKGILLYGPPGTGKTLMARQIGKMLNAKEPKIVSGPEILSKFVGQSEENVRKLFADAEDEYRKKGEDSSLHIIIFDELDAICKSRGTRSGDTGVGDSVVNQLLAKMDGVEQLNNILIIGMTNRKDMIDEAILRPGRLEVHMEIGLPDEKGRLQILKIHTSKMRSNDALDSDVSLEELADLTKNYSGAEISGVVKAATSYAFSRHIKVGSLEGVSTDMAEMKICMDDFLNALKEVQPAFGVSEVELQQCVQNHIIPFSPRIEQILDDGRLYVDQVRQSSRTPLVSVLLNGPTSAGKTALAATIAMRSDFPFIKLISPETMVGMTESQKVNEINKIFNDSYKSPISVIVIDAIERLLDYVPIGPRFSNAVLQALLVLLKKKPPKDRRLLILATTSQHDILEQMGMTSEFSAEIYVPTITSLESMDIILQQLELFNDSEREEALSRLKEANMDQKLTLGIKKLLMIIEMARQDKDKVDKFVNTILYL